MKDWLASLWADETCRARIMVYGIWCVVFLAGVLVGVVLS